MRRPILGALTLGASALVALVTLRAAAQRVDPRRPAVFIVGSARGSSPTQRGDGHRSGTSREALPVGTLHVAWRRSIALALDQPALAGDGGSVAVVSARGDVVFLDGDGEELSRASAGSTPVGPATLTSDGTVVFVTSSGDAVGVRRTSSRPRFVRRVGGERNGAAPLSLDDGGVVVATLTDLVALDAEGNVRTRVTLPEAPASALLATADRVVAVTTSGLVYGWNPGREAVRLGSFGARIDGGATLIETSNHGSALLAVIEGTQLVELDLTHGTRSTRSIAAQGLYLGPPSARAVATDGGVHMLATLLAQTASLAFVVTVDPVGQETLRAPIATLTPATLADGGPAPLVGRPHTGPLVDARGAVAYASPEGRVGVVSADGAVVPLGELICTPTPRSAGIAGLTALPGGAFLVTCESGLVAKVVGPEAPSLRARPSSRPPAPPPRPPLSGDPVVEDPDEP